STSAVAAAVETSATRTRPPAKYGTSVTIADSHSTEVGGTCTHAAETIIATATSTDETVTSDGPNQTSCTLNQRASRDPAAAMATSSASAAPLPAVQRKSPRA